MKSLKQDLVGFHWSAFFEPRLPFTRVPVKTPSAPPPTSSLYLFLSFPPPSSALPSPPLPPLSSPAHPPVYILSTCNGNTHLSLLLFHLLPTLMTSDPLFSPLYSITFCHHAGWTPPSPFPAHACIFTHLPQTSITKSIPLNISKTLRGPFFLYFPDLIFFCFV